MKTKMALVLMFSLVAGTSFAQGDAGHGGDIACDAKIQTITENIKAWITDGGPEVGKLDLSSSLDPITKLPYTLPMYSSAMKALLAKNLLVSCVGPGDVGYPVMVENTPKICKNTYNLSGIYMVCDRALFKALSDDEKIQQIHHEFATDVPGLEPDDGPLSTYKISIQLSSYTINTTERRLAVMLKNDPNLSDKYGKCSILYPNQSAHGEVPCVNAFAILYKGYLAERLCFNTKAAATDHMRQMFSCNKNDHKGNYAILYAGESDGLNLILGDGHGLKCPNGTFGVTYKGISQTGICYPSIDAAIRAMLHLKQRF